MSDHQDQSPEAIRHAVLDRYSQIASEFDPATAADCCAPAPAAAAEAAAGCCDDAREAAYFDHIYQTDLSGLPVEVTGLSLGCGDPLALASLQPGQTVLDLGSGGGIDCFLAAAEVGEQGHVIGVDMTEAMLARANANLEKVGATNVEFRRGEIEALPVEDETVDVIISNCVINLSTDKPAVFREAFRVLKPGGRLAVSDMVRLGELTAEERADLVSWSGCIAGAEEVDFYVRQLARAGFTHISIRDRDQPDIELAGALHLPMAKARVFSARITAVKEGNGEQGTGNGG